MIDPKIQSELREKFNPEGSMLRNMQLRMLDMLLYIDRVCVENNIKYWLSSGTCLGAVRHGGFIPWDDDVDIEMERSEYKRLIDILSKSSSPYILQNYETDCEYVHVFSKIRDKKSLLKENNNTDKWIENKGLFIDIFALEPSFSKLLSRISGSIWNRTVSKFPYIKNQRQRQSCIRLIRSLLLKIIYPPLKLWNRMWSKNKYRHSLGSMFMAPRYKNDFKEIIRISFEGYALPIPKGFDHYLQSLYGDYMKLPDLSSITPHASHVELYD